MNRPSFGRLGSAALLALLCGRLEAGEPTPPEVGIGLALVLDTSGSIQKEELARSRALCISILERLPAGSEAALFTFDDQSRLLLPWTSSAADIGRALGIVERTGRFTALHDALFDASLYLRNAGHSRRILLLISDGKDEGSTLNIEDGLRVAFDNQIPVYAVGVGRIEERVMKRIAKLTSGEYLRLAETDGAGLAAKMATVALPRGPAPSTGAAAVPGGAPEASRRAGLPPASASSATRAIGTVPAPRNRVWAVVGVAFVATCALGLVFVKRRHGPRCPACGLDLASPLASCTSCSAQANSRIAEIGRARASHPVRDRETDRSVLSETVIARMNQTEEFLEKTVTLHEQPVLRITAGPGSGQIYALSAEVLTCIGRARANDIVLDDVSVSSEHCRVRSEEGEFVVHDLKSTNGTFVNERRVTRQPLAVGDVIKVGETLLQFRMDHART